MQRPLIIATLALLACHLAAQEKKPNDIDEILRDLPRVKSLEPAEALKAIVVRPGFRVELAACEPLVQSPVAVDFDESGRLFVAEFPEYNQYANPDYKGHGCIKLLEDTDGDGRFDKATRYVDELDSPVAVACWDGGVFVGAVPDLLFFKDTDGDGKADVKKKVLTGFERDKAGEGMLNSFRWGPDNRLHISTGLAGGNIRKADDVLAKPVAVRRQNIRFDPRTGDFELTSGGSQHGMTLDDWGNTFVCGNSDPIQYLSYDSRYLARSPYTQAPSPVVDINAAGRHCNLHRISPGEPWREARTKLRKDKLVPGSDEGGKPFGFFTGATGVTVYRGHAFPEEFRGNIFVGEVANNLVYRAKLQPDGLGFKAIRAEEGREFLASKDICFRPVQFANAPDGCLYVVDMARELIEGAAFLPPQLLKHVDVAGGMNRGRIWRIVSENFKREKPPQLAKAATKELVALLEHPNGWHRDTAARLLYQRQDREGVTPLRKLASESKSPQGRMHAHHALASLKALTSDDVLRGLKDADAHVREHVLRMAESFGNDTNVARQLAQMVDDSNARVRCQLAYSLFAFPPKVVDSTITRLILKDGADARMRLAALCTLGDRGATVLDALLVETRTREVAGAKEMITSLAAQIAAGNKPDEIMKMLRSISQLPDSRKALATELVRILAAKLPARAKWAKDARIDAIMAEMLADARNVAVDEKKTPEVRAAALRSLGIAEFTQIKELLDKCLDVKQPQPVQLAALETLASKDDASVPAMVLEAWPAMSPRIRASATEVLLSRPAWAMQMLDAIEKGSVRPSDIEPARVQLLLKSPDEMIQKRAAKLFAGSALSKRSEVIDKYQKALELKGDAAKGKAIFKNNCAVCHKLEGVGEAVGPDLAASRNRGNDVVMTNILDPNREVLPQFFGYNLTTDAGLTIAGMITAETANAVTIRRVDGTSATVLRVNIESLRSTGQSAMPEGLEKQIDVQAMADLLSYLSSVK